MNVDEMTAALERPFAPDEVRWKPQAVKGNRAMAIAYIDARAVMDRLDEVFGLDGWEDEYQTLPGGNAVCVLRCRFPDGQGGFKWVKKADTGSESEQPDAGDKVKAAFSDALKRAAVKLGIGRYLYRLPHQWVDYDGQKRAFAKTPTLPKWAMPAVASKPPDRESYVTEDDIAEILQLATGKGFSEDEVKAAAKLADLSYLTKTVAKQLYDRISKAPARAAGGAA